MLKGFFIYFLMKIARLVRIVIPEFFNFISSVFPEFFNFETLDFPELSNSGCQLVLVNKSRYEKLCQLYAYKGGRMYERY